MMMTPLLRVEAVHLHAITGSASARARRDRLNRADAARLAQGIQLIDEDDARALSACAWAKRSRTRAAPTPDEHLDEVGAAQAEEGDPGLPGHGLGQQRLAGAGRPDEKGPLGDLAAEAAVAVRGS